MRKLNDILVHRGPFHMWDNSLVLMYRGSHSHGTHIPNSNPGSIDDTDIFGVCLPPRDYFFGIKTFDQFECKEGEWDVLVYDLRKFIRLVEKANPNVLNALWTPEKFYIRNTDLWRKLVVSRDIFSCKKIYHSFCGYAYGQLHKMENMAYNGYMGQKRKGLVDKFGYDTKNAQHLVRLLRQGVEFMRTGKLVVERPDAEELKQIKLGAWSIDKVKRVASDLFKEMESAKNESKLPESVDAELVNALTVEITSTHYAKR